MSIPSIVIRPVNGIMIHDVCDDDFVGHENCENDIDGWSLTIYSACHPHESHLCLRVFLFVSLYLCVFVFVFVSLSLCLCFCAFVLTIYPTRHPHEPHHQGAFAASTSSTNHHLCKVEIVIIDIG